MIVTDENQVGDAFRAVGIPAAIKSSFGLGKGVVVVETEEEFRSSLIEALRLSPTNEVIVEKVVIHVQGPTIPRL